MFPLQEIRKYLTEQIQNQMLMNQNMVNMDIPSFPQNIKNYNSINIYDCFDFNFNFYTCNNSIYCNNCKRQLSSSCKTILFTTPEILIIALNRGKGIEFHFELEFSEYLNLMNYVKMKDTGFKYTLIGIVSYVGEENDPKGHFIAYCKSPIDGQWYNYNDDIVTQVNNFKELINTNTLPFILFYQKTDVMN